MTSLRFVKASLFSIYLLLLSSPAFSQTGDTRVLYPGSCSLDNLKIPHPVPLNGNGSLGSSYNLTKCGLNFVQASVKLGQRFNVSCCPSTVGVAQPAPFAISGLPSCGVIEKAYVYASISGNGVAVNISVTNPAAQNQNFAMSIIGQDQDKCWAYQGTYTYRADVTSIINGNGNYIISGLPVDPSANLHSNDTDGATLLIVYSNPTQAYQGEIYIWDGCVAGIGNTSTMNINNFNACANSSSAQAFIAVGDLQQINSSFVLNGGAPFQIGLVEDWYNWIQQPTSVSSGQNTSNFQVQASGDCYNFMLAGLYFQTTTCTTCTFQQANINVQSTSTPAACGVNNGSVTANPTGGVAPYTYVWNTSPAQTTQTATGLAPGQYIVVVSDATGCNSGIDTVTVGQVGGTTVTSSSTPVLCNGGSTGSATANPQTGQSPYTYSWSTTPSQTNATATGLSAGTYTVTQTDGMGCTDTSIVIVTQPPVLTSVKDSINVLCNGNNTGSAWVTASGGVGNYTYSWTTLPVQTSDTAVNLTAGTYTCFITDANGCSIQKIFNITQPPPLVLTSVFTIADCGIPNGNATVSVTGGNGPYTYSWNTNPVQTTAAASNLANGNYTVYVVDANNCTANMSIAVIDANDPVAQFTVTPTVTSISDPNFSFTDLSVNATSWTWSFGDPGDSSTSNLQNPTHTYSDTGTFCIMLIVSNAVCSDTTVNCVVVQPELSIFVPNAFTPNGDGKNDVFMPLGEFIGEFQMYIFDRWGNNIFKSTDTKIGWDGKANGGTKTAQEDTYVWVIYCVDPQNREHKYVGHVSLIH
jgi:gliding motility-associated-like protein